MLKRLQTKALLCRQSVNLNDLVRPMNTSLIHFDPFCLLKPPASCRNGSKIICMVKFSVTCFDICIYIYIELPTSTTVFDLNAWNVSNQLL